MNYLRHIYYDIFATNAKKCNFFFIVYAAPLYGESHKSNKNF